MSLYTTEVTKVMRGLHQLGLNETEWTTRLNQWKENFRQHGSELNLLRGQFVSRMASISLGIGLPSVYDVVLMSIFLHWRRHGELDNGWGSRELIPGQSFATSLSNDAVFWTLAEMTEYAPITIELDDEGTIVFGRNRDARIWTDNVRPLSALVPWIRFWSFADQMIRERYQVSAEEFIEGNLSLVERARVTPNPSVVLINYPLRFEASEQALHAFATKVARQLPPVRH